MYRVIPMRVLRRTHETRSTRWISDIPKIDGIDRVIHGANSIKRPWYMHTHQDDNLMVLQGTRYVDIFCPRRLVKSSFVITPDKNNKLYFDGSALIVWPSGIFHRRAHAAQRRVQGSARSRLQVSERRSPAAHQNYSGNGTPCLSLYSARILSAIAERWPMTSGAWLRTRTDFLAFSISSGYSGTG